MSLFKGPMHTRIEGYKELTESKNAITIHPNKVSIPIFSSHDGIWVQNDLLDEMPNNPIIEESIKLYEEEIAL